MAIKEEKKTKVPSQTVDWKKVDKLVAEGMEQEDAIREATK